MFQEIIEKIKKSNEQRLKMALTLINVMKNTQHCTLEVRTAVAASMLEMLERDMMPEDGILTNMLNECVNDICAEANEKLDITDMRDRLKLMVVIAREKTNRVNEGDSILNNINFN
jgi:hypothetical protein